jgi:hypothetical protein
MGMRIPSIFLSLAIIAPFGNKDQRICSYP